MNKLTLARRRRLRERRAFVKRALAGQTDYPLTNEELESQLRENQRGGS